MCLTDSMRKLSLYSDLWAWGICYSGFRRKHESLNASSYWGTKRAVMVPCVSPRMLKKSRIVATDAQLSVVLRYPSWFFHLFFSVCFFLFDLVSQAQVKALGAYSFLVPCISCSQKHMTYFYTASCWFHKLNPLLPEYRPIPKDPP